MRLETWAGLDISWSVQFATSGIQSMIGHAFHLWEIWTFVCGQFGQKPLVDLNILSNVIGQFVPFKMRNIKHLLVDLVHCVLSITVQSCHDKFLDTSIKERQLSDCLRTRHRANSFLALKTNTEPRHVISNNVAHAV